MHDMYTGDLIHGSRLFSVVSKMKFGVRTSHQKIIWILVELHFVVKYVLYMHAIIHLNIIIKKKDIDTKRRTPLFG